MTASYSLGAALSAPIFGYFSNKMRQIKIPAIIGLFIIFLSNLCFMLIEFIPKNRKYFLLIARLGHGIGIGLFNNRFSFFFFSSRKIQLIELVEEINLIKQWKT